MHNNGRRPTPLTQKEFRAAIARGLAPPASVAAAPALAANASPARIGRPTRRGADVRGGSMCPPGFKQPRKKTTSNPERRSTGASRLTHGRAGGYNLLGSEGVKRFAGQPSIPGEHRISSVHDNLGGRNNYTCTICRLLVHQGLLKNPDGSLHTNARHLAKIVCHAGACEGRVFCSADCFSVWHYRSAHDAVVARGHHVRRHK